MVKKLAALLAFMLLPSLAAWAHPNFQNPMWVEYSEHEITVKMHVSAKEVCTAVGIPIDGEGRVEKELVEDAASRHGDYVLSHFTLAGDGVDLKGSVTGISPPKAWEGGYDGVDRSHFIFNLAYPTASPVRRVSLSQRMMAEFSYAPGTPFNFSYMVRFGPQGQEAKDFGPLPQGGIFDFSTGIGTIPEEAAEPPRTSTDRFKSFLHDGILHVLHGYDHLLFATALVLALRSFWELFKIIGVFTLAHTITVTLSAYQIIRLPGWFPVEPLIAGSIVFVALENVLFPQGARGWRRTAITFMFGLVHGLGLAGAFVENLQGFSVGLIAWAIIGFCVGVEVGHLMIVGPLSFVMAGGRKLGHDRFSRGALRWGSVLVAVGGLYFFLNALGFLPESIAPDRLFGAQ